MHHRSVTFVLCMVMVLGLFFQYNRDDGFLHLIENTNTVDAMGQVREVPGGADSLPKERYLLIYDPISSDSLRLRLNIERALRQLKKEVKVMSARETVEDGLNYSGVICTVVNWDNIKSMDVFRRYVQGGGTLYFLYTPSQGAVFAEMATEVGISGAAMEEPGLTKGTKMLSDVLLGAQDAEFSGPTFAHFSLPVTIAEQSKLHMQSLSGVPLLWETFYGKGSYIVYNGSNLHEKENRGLLIGILGLTQSYYVYPVIGIKTVYIDDFPAPVPDGYNEKISTEYQLSTAQFFRQVWWSDMLGSASKYDVKYTGMIIETYNDNVTPPFVPENNDGTNRDNLILYGRELLKSGGELGVHGYNHQSLVPNGQRTEESYKVWASKADIAQSIAEVKRYIEKVYPGYKLKVYVPPSNILSPEGRQAVVEGLPDLKVIASIAAGSGADDISYIQEYSRSPDGILEMPRLSVDYSRHDNEDWSIYNGITYLGVFSHFVHPDNIFYAENEHKTWREMHEGFDSLLKMLKDKFRWLRSCTVSQGAEYFEDYLNLDYRVTGEKNRQSLVSWGNRQDVYFVLRTPRPIKSTEGCRMEKIGENAYLLKISDVNASILFAD
ncbi:MAG: DUF2194 domain-containing protein [Sporomusaceae bacterium]|nr:DUF2194 domain-containing protein [Sporomusaceae bacterium]